ncbi:MAG: NAD(P)H-dependent oxidoreductase [Erysipelotrichaceae bacterium]
MKIVTFSGSYRKMNSISNEAINSLIEIIETEQDISGVTSYSADNIELYNCKGCCNCFVNGACSIDDDLRMIKKDILDSNLFVLASPVFAHNVSGVVKTLIDRLASMSHCMELIGRYAIVIIVTDGNGADYVSEYLTKILQYFGFLIIGEIIIKSKGISKSAIKSIVRIESKKIIKQFNSREIGISQSQEEYFQALKRNMKFISRDLYEKKVWELKKLGQFNEFKSAFEYLK